MIALCGGPVTVKARAGSPVTEVTGEDGNGWTPLWVS
jgi:hypothetical protein